MQQPIESKEQQDYQIDANHSKCPSRHRILLYLRDKQTNQESQDWDA